MYVYIICMKYILYMFERHSSGSYQNNQGPFLISHQHHPVLGINLFSQPSYQTNEESASLEGHTFDRNTLTWLKAVWPRKHFNEFRSREGHLILSSAELRKKDSFTNDVLTDPRSARGSNSPPHASDHLPEHKASVSKKPLLFWFQNLQASNEWKNTHWKSNCHHTLKLHLIEISMPFAKIAKQSGQRCTNTWCVPSLNRTPNLYDGNIATLCYFFLHQASSAVMKGTEIRTWGIWGHRFLLAARVTNPLCWAIILATYHLQGE